MQFSIGSSVMQIDYTPYRICNQVHTTAKMTNVLESQRPVPPAKDE
jgi:hypothetical protein